MNVYEISIYNSPLSSYKEQFLAEDWNQATEKTNKLLEYAKASSKTPKQVEIEKLEKLCELSEV